jgi:hypothetical protein
MKKIISLLLLFALGMAMSVPLGFAAEEEAEEDKNKIVITNANPGDYFQFMFNTRSRNGTGQIFKDITRSRCQLRDILALDDELDTTRDSLRSAAFQGKKTTDLKLKYRAILMEMYFVRNIQKTPSGLLNKRDIQKIEDGQEKNLDALETEMVKVFVTDQKWLSSERQLSSYFDEWEHKYAEKILNNYVRCENSPWAEITKTWNEFLDNMNNLEIKVEKYDGKPFGLDNFNFDPEFDTNFDDITVFDKLEPLFPYDNFEKSQSESQKDIDIPLSIEEVAKSSSRPTFESVLETLAENELNYQIELDYAMRKARFEILYGAGGALPAQNLDKIVSELNNLIQRNNVADFPYIQDSIDTIYGKQCS